MKQAKQENINKRMRTRLKTGDTVIVIHGKDKGKQGVIQAVVRQENCVKLKVSGIAMRYKHIRANPQTQEEGGIVQRESLIDASNVMFYDTAHQCGRRIGIKTVEGKRIKCLKIQGNLVEIEATA